jgi:peroxiredoxin
MKKTLIALMTILAVLIACSQYRQSSTQRLSKGDTAPLFSLPLLDGNEEVVAAKHIYKAYGTVLIFWSMKCPSCREALIECQEVYDKFRDRSCVFYGINFDTENTQGVRAFLKGENITIPHLWDRGQNTTKAYKALDYTFSVFVIDRDDKIVLALYDHPPDLKEILSEVLDELLPGGENE